VTEHDRTSGAVVLCADRSAAAHSALRWAVAEAARRKAPLQVVAAAVEPALTRRSTVLADAITAIRASLSGLPILGRTAHGPVVDTLRELSVDAAAVVVPVTLPELADVVATSFCPVVTVPEPASGPRAGRGPVVLGAAPWTVEEVVELAFREAAERRARLIAVRTWSDPLIDIGSLRPEQLPRWDRAEDRTQRELELELSPWTVIHPQVHLETMVVQDRATDFLLDLSHRAQLLVLGRSTRGALLRLIAGSPAVALLRAAHCPVIVVPAAGPPRTTWLPAAAHGRSLSPS
jgi:nucleotide-binding universal stress UspA family protein